MKAINRVPTIDASAVAVNTVSTGKPFCASGCIITGIRARIYTIVVNVVMPEIISVLRLSRCMEKPMSANNLSFILLVIWESTSQT